jgi:hypothetical protein
MARLQAGATLVWTVLACGAAVGFVARDLLELPPLLVALGWLAGAGLALAAWFGGALGGEDGQATVEWTGLVLMAALALGALVAVAPVVDGRPFGGFLAHHFACAVKGGCRDGDRALARAYGERGAALVREYAPNVVYEPGERQLPVDWRRCRDPGCANAPDERGLDVHRTDHGERATVFTRVLRRGGRTYIQYWFYYPDSNTTWAASDKAWEGGWLIPRLAGIVDDAPRYAGFHRDDWESYFVRLEEDGSAWVRASSHGHWQGCKEEECKNEWTRRTGWTRVSRGSHAGHIPLRLELPEGRYRVHPRQLWVPERRRPRRRWVPQLPGRDLDERTSTAEGLRLIPLETHDKHRYRPNHQGVNPPWRKDAYRDPESDES